MRTLQNGRNSIVDNVLTLCREEARYAEWTGTFEAFLRLVEGDTEARKLLCASISARLLKGLDAEELTASVFDLEWTKKMLRKYLTAAARETTTPRFLMLNGPSCAGKSTIVNALMRVLLSAQYGYLPVVKGCKRGCNPLHLIPSTEARVSLAKALDLSIHPHAQVCGDCSGRVEAAGSFLKVQVAMRRISPHFGIAAISGTNDIRNLPDTMCRGRRGVVEVTEIDDRLLKRLTSALLKVGDGCVVGPDGVEESFEGIVIVHGPADLKEKLLKEGGDALRRRMVSVPALYSTDLKEEVKILRQILSGSLSAYVVPEISLRIAALAGIATRLKETDMMDLQARLMYEAGLMPDTFSHVRVDDVRKKLEGSEGSEGLMPSDIADCIRETGDEHADGIVLPHVLLKNIALVAKSRKTTWFPAVHISVKQVFDNILQREIATAYCSDFDVRVQELVARYVDYILGDECPPDMRQSVWDERQNERTALAEEIELHIGIMTDDQRYAFRSTLKPSFREMRGDEGRLGDPVSKNPWVLEAARRCVEEAQFDAIFSILSLKTKKPDDAEEKDRQRIITGLRVSFPAEVIPSLCEYALEQGLFEA